MSQIQALTKSLSEIVANLKEAISRNKNTLQPERQKMKKKSDMTYHDFLEKALQGKNSLSVNQKKMSYRLQEDLTLLFQLSNYSEISVKTFQEIARQKKINRTTQSLKSRYHEHLYKIQQGEMKRIINWIERQGLQGYLLFQDNELLITKIDPRDKQQQKKRSRTISLDQQGKKSQKKSAKIKAIPINCKQLNDILKIYSKMVNAPVKILLQKLNQVSGNLVELDNYMETKDQRLLWSVQEDIILKKGGLELDILKRYRGITSVEIRKRYLGIE